MSVIPIPIFSTQLDELKTEVTEALGRLGRVGEDNQTLLEKINNLGSRLAALDSKDGEIYIVSSNLILICITMITR